MSSHDLFQDLIAAVIAVVVAWLTSKVTITRSHSAASSSQKSQPPVK